MPLIKFYSLKIEDIEPEDCLKDIDDCFVSFGQINNVLGIAIRLFLNLCDSIQNF